MSTTRERIENALRERICTVCVEAAADGCCGLPAGVACPLLSRLDDVIAVVADRSAPNIDPYIARLREIVCETCETDERGNCRRRNRLECALDMYFPLVIEVIEKELRPQPA